MLDMLAKPGRRGISPGNLRALGLALATTLFLTPLSAQSFDWGGSFRYFQFLRTESLPEFPGASSRRDSEFSSLRLTLTSQWTPQVKFESHAVLDFLSPPAVGAASLATGSSSTYLPLERDFTGSEDYDLTGRFDRLNLQVNLDNGIRLVAGRQAITWGVTYFWPVMDLFSSFAPERVDREYKEGVDAIRANFPLGAYSELQVIGAVLGSSLKNDGAAAAQLRLHLGRLDLGLMGGKFHRDTVAGVFITTDWRGAAVRAETTWTQSGDPFDRTIGRRTFWRASGGIDRQLSPDWNLTFEFSFNGYGFSQAEDFLLLSQSDRIQRGEVNALGRYFGGAALSWELHPLWTLSNTLLVNWQDPSALWIPVLEWSTGDDSAIQFGAQSGFGGEFDSDLRPRSEYGPAPVTLFASARWYF